MLVASRPALVVAAAIITILLGGCGLDNGPANRYVKAVNAAQAAFAATVDRAAQSITPTSTPRQDQATLRRFQDAIDVVVADLRKITPPSKVRAEHTRLVAAMTRFDSEVTKANNALQSPTGTTLQQAQESIRRATITVNTAIKSTITSINSKLGK